MFNVHKPQKHNVKKVNQKKINTVWHILYKFKNTQKTLVNTILDSYVLIKILNMLVEKIHQPQNGGYLQGEKDKGNRIAETQGFWMPSNVLFLTDIWQMLTAHEKYSTALILRKMQVESIVRNYFILTRMAF